LSADVTPDVLLARNVRRFARDFVVRNISVQVFVGVLFEITGRTRGGRSLFHTENDDDEPTAADNEQGNIK